jgi:hypothetical protein
MQLINDIAKFSSAELGLLSMLGLNLDGKRSAEAVAEMDQVLAQPPKSAIDYVNLRILSRIREALVLARA